MKQALETRPKRQRGWIDEVEARGVRGASLRIPRWRLGLVGLLLTRVSGDRRRCSLHTAGLSFIREARTAHSCRTLRRSFPGGRSDVYQVRVHSPRPAYGRPLPGMRWRDSRLARTVPPPPCPSIPTPTRALRRDRNLVVAGRRRRTMHARGQCDLNEPCAAGYGRNRCLVRVGRAVGHSSPSAVGRSISTGATAAGRSHENRGCPRISGSNVALLPIGFTDSLSRCRCRWSGVRAFTRVDAAGLRMQYLSSVLGIRPCGAIQSAGAVVQGLCDHIDDSVSRVRNGRDGERVGRLPAGHTHRAAVASRHTGWDTRWGIRLRPHDHGSSAQSHAGNGASPGNH